MHPALTFACVFFSVHNSTFYSQLLTCDKCMQNVHWNYAAKHEPIKMNFCTANKSKKCIPLKKTIGNRSVVVQKWPFWFFDFYTKSTLFSSRFKAEIEFHWIKCVVCWSLPPSSSSVWSKSTIMFLSLLTSMLLIIFIYIVHHFYSPNR